MRATVLRQMSGARARLTEMKSLSMGSADACLGRQPARLNRHKGIASFRGIANQVRSRNVVLRAVLKSIQSITHRNRAEIPSSAAQRMSLGASFGK
ncbi:MAG: hypothetical protein ACI8W7_003512, partial [Gammaproteobacteria bacterium]